MLTVRTTYALDRDTVERLELLARSWRLSRSAVLRKIVREAELPQEVQGVDPRLAALRNLHALYPISRKEAETWKREIRAERRARDRRLPER